jgi:hypothetical protein
MRLPSEVYTKNPAQQDIVSLMVVILNLSGRCCNLCNR